VTSPVTKRGDKEFPLYLLCFLEENRVLSPLSPRNDGPLVVSCNAANCKTRRLGDKTGKMVKKLNEIKDLFLSPSRTARGDKPDAVTNRMVTSGDEMNPTQLTLAVEEAP